MKANVITGGKLTSVFQIDASDAFLARVGGKVLVAAQRMQA